MKFGVVIHKPTMNLGDDIQTYAAAKLLILKVKMMNR